MVLYITQSDAQKLSEDKINDIIINAEEINFEEDTTDYEESNLPNFAKLNNFSSIKNNQKNEKFNFSDKINSNLKENSYLQNFLDKKNYNASSLKNNNKYSNQIVPLLLMG